MRALDSPPAVPGPWPDRAPHRAASSLGLSAVASADPGTARVPRASRSKILVHLGLDSTGPPLAPARREPDPVEPAPDYDVPNPVSS